MNVEDCIPPVSTTSSDLKAIQNNTQIEEDPDLKMSKRLQHALTFLSEEHLLEHSLQSLCVEKPYHSSSVAVAGSIGEEMARMRRPSNKGLSPTGASKPDLLSFEETFTEVFSGAVRGNKNNKERSAVKGLLRFFSSKWHSVYDPGG